MLITSQRVGDREMLASEFLSENEPLMLECWTCRKHAKMERILYDYGKLFELGDAAKGVGWITEVDFVRKRKLVFCSEDCKRTAQYKDGYFRRMRPIPKG